MAPDIGTIDRGCGRSASLVNQLCGKELDLFRSSLADSADITVTCTQEAPLFQEVAESHTQTRLNFVNIREMAGWSKDGSSASPKMAALIAASAVEMPPVSMVTMESAGVALIYGTDGVAIDVASRLADTLDITVLLHRPKDVPPRAVNEFPVLKGTIRNAKGHLGAFELAIDDYALPLPSSRKQLVFADARNGATSTCDLVIDLSGNLPLFPAHELRPGYLRADPRDQAAVARLILEARNLVGTFDKPRYIQFDASLCAHSRSNITGCTRCLDLCPTGAITPDCNSVAIDANVCAGCGACASACPTGAASYALPAADALMRRLREMLAAYRKAEGEHPVVLFHDSEHGMQLIEALARFGDGLPANVLPLQLNELTQLGPELLAAPFAYGGTGVALLTRARPRHDIVSLQNAAEISAAIVEGLGYGKDTIRLIQTDDPDQLRQQLDEMPQGNASPKPASFAARGARRGMLETTFRELHKAAPAPVDSVSLPPGAPFGGVELNLESCTLCHSCVTACPTHALSDNPDRAMLRFTESLCVQCGLCESTCPEDAIELVPRLDFAAWQASDRILKEEEPFHCIACGTAFGTRSSIERVLSKLQERHWMFEGANAQRLDVIKMCANCRVEAVINESFDPHAAPRQAPMRTTEDYLRERDLKKN